MSDRNTLEGLVVFGRVISAALLLGGFIVLGALMGNRLMADGWPAWAGAGCAAGGAAFGAWQAWLFLRPIWSKSKETGSS